MMFMEKERIKPANVNTFGHAFLVAYEKRIDRDDRKAVDRVLLRLFLQDVNTIIELLNVALPDAESIAKYGYEHVQDCVGPQFHKNFRQVDVLANGHLDMAIYIILRSCSPDLFWLTLEEMAKVVEGFVKKKRGDWGAFIAEQKDSEHVY